MTGTETGGGTPGAEDRSGLRRLRRPVAPVTALAHPVAEAVRLVWRASPGRATVAALVQSLASVSLFLQVLLVQRVLAAVLAVGRDSGVGGAVLPITLLAALSALTSIGTTVAGLQQRVLGELVSREVWRRVLHVSQRVPLSAYEDPEFYDQAQRVQSSAASQTQIVVQALVVLLGGALGAVAGAAAVLTIAPVLLPLLLLSGVPLYLTSRAAGRREFAFVQDQTPNHRRLGYLQAVLTRRDEAKEVRAYSLSTAFRQRWETLFETYLDALDRHVRRRLRLALVGNVLAALLTSGALLVALVLVDRGTLTVARAATALVAVRLLAGRVSAAVLGVSTLYESSLFLADLRAFLRRSATGPTASSGVTIGTLRGEIVVDDVTFTYPAATRPALRGVDLRLRRGEVVALVGENGSGKSTLAKLLADLYVPDSGTISWDGVRLGDHDPESVRRQVAVVFQDFVKYQLSARDNIGLLRSDLPEDRLLRAAEQADADAFLSQLPDGYGTVLSKEYEGGADLSLGQWQRVALARAFVRDAGLVVLDEPSAALDARAEHALFAQIRTLFQDRTVLIVSHRFSTVRAADHIYVLRQGEVAEHGTHDELVREDGLYAELYALQASTQLAPERGTS